VIPLESRTRQRHRSGEPASGLGNWTILEATALGEAIPILDLYHALEHLDELCEELFAVPSAKEKTTRWFEMLKNDQVADVIAEAKEQLRALALGADAQEKLQTKIDYFEKNKSRMLYKTYRDAGLFYGSGVVEAGCKAVIGQRLKNSGMFWTQSGATNILNLRCALKGNRWNECWERLHDSTRLKLRPAA